MSLYSIKKDEKTSFTEKNSTFISYSFFVTNTEEIRSKLSLVEKEHPDATHIVWAYSLYEFSQQRYTDAGEPQGTAGLPIMNMIKLKDVLNVLIVVVRYFGGTLLGAGGLVRAYAKAANLVIDASGKTELTEVATFECSTGYDNLKTINNILTRYDAVVITTDYKESVVIKASLPLNVFESFKKEALEILYKGLDINILESKLSRL